MTSGGEAGLGKRSLLEKYSLLVLSKDLIKRHPDAWCDADIEARAAELTDHICQVWTGPPVGTHAGKTTQPGGGGSSIPSQQARGEVPTNAVHDPI